MPNHVSANCGTWRVLPEGMSQMFRLLYLGNGWADCVEIWHALGDPLVTAYTVVTGGVPNPWLVESTLVMTRNPHTKFEHISARAHVQRYPHTALLYLGNGLADCVQIWYVGWGSLTKCLPQVIDEVHLHVRTCAPLFHKCSACCFSVTVGPTALKFGMHLGTH